MWATESLLAYALAATVASAPAPPAEPTCARHPSRVGECRGVHGRLSLANGNPSERIWPVGTTRILGVTGRFEQSLPQYLREVVTWDVNLYGDFWVCPLFDRPRPGHMEFVCVHSWRNLVKEDRTTHSVTRIPMGPAPEWPGPNR
jgi:hypothetical protein